MSDARRLMETGDQMDPMHRAICGIEDMQLRIPVRDQMDLRRAATILREFANKLEVLSDPRRYPDWSAIAAARIERTAAQSRLKSRPKLR